MNYHINSSDIQGLYNNIYLEKDTSDKFSFKNERLLNADLYRLYGHQRYKY